MAGIDSPAGLARTAFRTSRLLDFCSEKELIAQIGHEPNDWPAVVIKELIDNALDAAEESGTVEIEAHGVRHTITFTVDRVYQKPVIDHREEAGLVKTGTWFTVHWPVSSRLRPH
jgi:hypothetical protein